jgi:iron complex outermembrane receptor protein
MLKAVLRVIVGSSLSRLLLLAFVPGLAVTAQAAPSTERAFYEETIVIASPLSEQDARSSSPFHVQSLNPEDFRTGVYATVADVLARRAAGVSISQAQNNPLQPDVQVRGFSASPLLGASQGVAVYMNGVRINEPFGDTVNWDLIDDHAVQRLRLLSGANAAYGLNALGGSLAISTKTGFDTRGSTLALRAGSFGRTEAALSSGANNGRWGYFAGASGYEEDGWRNFSPTEAYNGYGALSFRDDAIRWDNFILLGDTALNGNGAAPEQLLAEDRAAVFTHPDETRNALAMVSSRLSLALGEGSSVTINGFIRNNNTDSFNGDGTEYEACEGEVNSAFLCDSETDERVVDMEGVPFTADFNAINNISSREQTSWGGTAEYRPSLTLGRVAHEFVVGLDYYRGDTDFRSRVELAQLSADRSTTRSGRYDPEGKTQLDAWIENTGIYLIDHVELIPERVQVVLSLRYNGSRLETEDRSGIRPALTASHRFSSVNPGIGLNLRAAEQLIAYGSLHQSSRTPTAVELACSHAEAPCTLPNTFLADPPLDTVVARNLELGLRDADSQPLNWDVSAFVNRIADDIVFQTTGGVASNEGFFSNASDTQRLGLNARAGEPGDRLDWQVTYAWLRATFESDFRVSSPNHPNATEGKINVQRGDRIPGLPTHQLGLNLNWHIDAKTDWLWDVHHQSGVYLRGDEANLDRKTSAFWTVNTTLRYQVRPKAEVYLTVNNLLDAEYESFGLYGEADEVLPNLEAGSGRFVSPGEPRGAWVGLGYRW